MGEKIRDDLNLCEINAQQSFSLQYYKKAIEQYLEASELCKKYGNDLRGTYCFKMAMTVADTAARFYLNQGRFEMVVDYMLIYRDLAQKSSNDELLKYGEAMLLNCAIVTFDHAFQNVWHHESKKNFEMVVLEAETGLRMLGIMKDYISIDMYGQDSIELHKKSASARVNMGFKKWDKLDFKGAMSDFEVAEKHSIDAGEEKMAADIKKLQAKLYEKSRIMDAVNALRQQ